MIDAWNAELRAATAADQPQPPVQPPTAPTVTGSSEDDDKAESASESEEDDDDVRPLPFLASIAPDGRSKCQYVHCPTREIRAGAARLGARPPSPRPGGNGRVQWFHVDCAFAATAWAGTRCRRSGPPDGLDALSPPDRARLLRLVADAKKRRRKADNGSERSVKQKSSSSGDAQPPAAPPPMSRGHWSEAEHAKFVAALAVHGRDWVKVAYAVGSRTLAQVRSHAQKHFLKQKDLANAPRGSGDPARAAIIARGGAGRRQRRRRFNSGLGGDAERARGGVLAPRAAGARADPGAAAAAPGEGGRRVGRRRHRLCPPCRPQLVNSSPGRVSSYGARGWTRRGGVRPGGSCDLPDLPSRMKRLWGRQRCALCTY